MPTFHYTALAGPDETVDGLIEAATRAAALDKLTAKGYFPSRLEEHGAGRSLRPGRVTGRDSALFTRQLADLLGAGMPLPEALRTTAEQMADKALGAFIQDMHYRVEAGASLADAMSGQQGVFSNVHIGMVRAGEAGGFLVESLGRLADFGEQEEELRSRVSAALAYPSLVLAIGVATVLFLLFYIVPKLSGVFDDMGEALPLATRALVGFARVSSSPLVLGGLAVAGILCILFFKPLAGWAGPRVAESFRALPYVRRWVAQAGLARLFRLLSVLLAGGIPILDSLELSSDVAGSPPLKRQVLQARTAVAAGSGLAAGLRTAGFPADVCRLVSIGEDGRRLEPALERIALSLERRRDQALKVMISLLEPILILGVGGVIALIVLGMLLPIFQLSSFVA